MAVSFDFTGTSGTALETYDSRFKSLEAGAFIIASGYLLKASGRVWWDDWFVFKNGQTDAQEIEVVVGPRALSGEDVHVNLHLNIDGITDPADRIDGYRVEVYASVIRLSKNGTMIVQENHSESVTGVEHTVRIKHEGTSVRVWLNGNLYINATDSTPLTGGWPGGKIYSAGNQAGAGLNALSRRAASMAMRPEQPSSRRSRSRLVRLEATPMSAGKSSRLRFRLSVATPTDRPMRAGKPSRLRFQSSLAMRAVERQPLAAPFNHWPHSQRVQLRVTGTRLERPSRRTRGSSSRRAVPHWSSACACAPAQFGPARKPLRSRPASAASTWPPMASTSMTTTCG